VVVSHRLRRVGLRVRHAQWCIEDSRAPHEARIVKERPEDEYGQHGER
jgi:hypothetical protein